MKAAKIRALDLGEISEALNDKIRELSNLKLAKRAGQVEKNHRFVFVKRDIARLKTILGEKCRLNREL